MGLGGSRLCAQSCEGDHPIKAVSQIKLKYLLGGLRAPGKAGVWPRPCDKELRQLSHVARDGCGTKGQDCSPAREIRQGSRIHRGLRQAWRGSWGVLTGRDDCMGSQTESRAHGGRVAGLEVVLAAVSEYTGDLWEIWLQRELRARPAWALERGVGTLVGSKGGLHVLIYSFIHSANMYCVQTLCQALPWVPGVH